MKKDMWRNYDVTEHIILYALRKFKVQSTDLLFESEGKLRLD